MREIFRGQAATWQPWLSKEEWKASFGNIYPDWMGARRKTMDSWRDRTLLDNFEKAWKLALENTLKLLRSPSCIKVLKAQQERDGTPAGP